MVQSPTIPKLAKWETVPIKDVYLGLYDGPHATPKPSEDGPVFLGIKNIREDGTLDLSNVRHISEEEFPKWTKRVVPKPGDIVFTYEATLHRYAMIPEGFRGCLGRRTALIRPNPERIVPQFLFYYFFSHEWRTVVDSNVLSGSTVDRIPLTDFPNFQITLPPIDEQQRIVSILSTYDDLIENNRRRIEILEEMARNIYREWFVHFRFPGHEDVQFVDSPLGPIPEGWEVKPASEAIEINPRERVDKDSEKAFVPMGSLSETNMLLGDIETRTGNNGAKFRNDDTLFARITPCLENGKTGFVQALSSEEEVALGSTEFIVLRSKTLTPEYVYLLARSDEFRDNAIASMSGATGRQRVRVSCFDTFQLANPDRETLSEFQKHVASLFRMIHVLAGKNETLQRTRDLLLPKLVRS